jgi:PleD family two-component response regulator
MLLENILINAGFDVAGASDGKEALIKFIDRTPDLVFLDMGMPVLDGYEAIKK